MNSLYDGSCSNLPSRAASSAGRVDRLEFLLRQGANVACADYDARTCVHLAASEGHVPALRFLLARAAAGGGLLDINAMDRFGNTPLDDAVQGRHFAAAALLRKLIEAQLAATPPDADADHPSDRGSDASSAAPGAGAAIV